MRFNPRIEYDVGPTVLLFSLSQRLWEPEEGVGYGDEDESGAGIIVSYVARYDYAVRVRLRFTDDERVSVMQFVEWVLKNKGESVLFRFDATQVSTEFSVYVDEPTVGRRVRPQRSGDAPWTWELSLVLRSTNNTRIHVPLYAELLPSVLERTTLGLVFRDQFARANGAAIGNSWTHDAYWSLLNGAARFASSDNTQGHVLHHAAAVGLASYIAQVNMRTSYTDAQTRLRLMNTAQTLTDADVLLKDVVNPSWRVSHTGEGVLGGLEEAVAANQWHTARLVRDAAAKIIRLYRSLNIANGTVLNVDPALVFTSAAVANNHQVDRVALISSLDFGAGPYTSDFDEVFVCGRDITIEGLPSGWKVQIDARPQVVSVGATITINPAAWALPLATITVRDDNDNVIDSLTPAEGIWGGDVYTVS